MFYIVNDNTNTVINDYQTEEEAKKDFPFFIIFANNKSSKKIHFSIKEDKDIEKESISKCYKR